MSTVFFRMSPQLKFLKELKTGELCIGFETDTLITSGVGSCVVLCMWDPTLKIGAMAHMFQSSREVIDSTQLNSDGASPDTAIPYLLQRMIGLRVKQNDIQTRLIGAGNMFATVEDGSSGDVGKGILSSTMLALTRAGLTLRSQSVGGSLGRSVRFSVNSGLIQVRLTNGETVTLR